VDARELRLSEPEDRYRSSRSLSVLRPLRLERSCPSRLARRYLEALDYRPAYMAEGSGQTKYKSHENNGTVIGKDSTHGM
jgi:hypothetical protein